MSQLKILTVISGKKILRPKKQSITDKPVYPVEPRPVPVGGGAPLQRDDGLDEAEAGRDEPEEGVWVVEERGGDVPQLKDNQHKA